MSLNPRVTDLGQDVRIDWTPDLEGQGYRLYVDGLPVSRTFKPDAHMTTFRKPDSGPHRYGLRLMDEIGELEEALWPLPDPGGNLIFAEAALSNPIELDIPASTTDFFLPEANRDYHIDLERVPRHGLVIWGPGTTGQVGNIRVNNAHFACTKLPSGDSGFRRGGLRFGVNAKHVSVTDYFKRSYDIADTGIDGLCFAGATHSRFTLQRALIEMQEDSTEPGAHLDAFQLQGGADVIEIGLASLDIGGVRAPNHAGKGLQLAYEAWAGGGDLNDPIKVDLRQVDFLCRGKPGGARAGVALVQEYREIEVSFNEVYWACPEELVAQTSPFEVTVYPHLRTATDFGVKSGSRPNRVLSWQTKPAAGFKGLFKERPVGNRFVTRSMLGY